MSVDGKKTLSIWIMNSKGGVGKTTLAIAVADFLLVNQQEPVILEIDSRKRLSSFIGETVSFDGAPSIEDMRKNPNAMLAHYDPVAEALMSSDTILDVGANEDGPFLEYCTLSRLDEDFQEENIQVVTLVPAVMESESIRGALEALASIHSAIPSARRVLVLNERDGSNWDAYLPAKVLKQLHTQGVSIIRIPRIVSEGWDDFQRNYMRFSDIIDQTPSDMSVKFGFARTKAKRSRGDIASWFMEVDAGLGSVIPEVVGDDTEAEESI